MGSSGTNQHQDLQSRVRAHLRERGFRPGDRLPGERELAAAVGAGRAALRPVLDALEAEGVLKRRPQSGTFLTAVPAARAHGATIALIAPFGGTGEPGRESDPVWLHRVVSAFERTVAPAGATLRLLDQSPRAGDPCSIKDLAREAIDARAGAAILLHPVGTRAKIGHALTLLHEAGVPPFLVSSRTYPGLASQVYFDSAWGAYLATRHLLQSGHRRIGFAGGPFGNEWVRERAAAYASALEAADRDAPDAWTWLPSDAERPAQPGDGAFAFARWQALPPPERPTGIVAANDVIALGFLEAARADGFSVPDDFSLVGFDNDPGALLAGLTTIERPTEALGEAVARVTLERLASGTATETAAVTHRLRPVLIERTSVGPPPAPKKVFP